MIDTPFLLVIIELFCCGTHTFVTNRSECKIYSHLVRVIKIKVWEMRIIHSHGYGGNMEKKKEIVNAQFPWYINSNTAISILN